MDTLSRIKLKLGIEDTKEDALLNIYIEDATNELLTILGLTDVPKQLNYIVEGVAIKLYRKAGSEGLKSEQIDVISNTFEESPFAQYQEAIQDYKNKTSRKLKMF